MNKQSDRYAEGMGFLGFFLGAVVMWFVLSMTIGCKPPPMSPIGQAQALERIATSLEEIAERENLCHCPTEKSQ